MNKRVLIVACVLLALALVVLRNGSHTEQGGDTPNNPKVAKAGQAPAGSKTSSMPPVTAPGTASQSGATNAPLMSVNRDPNFPYRLSNSIKTPAEIFHSETAILLRHAFIETTEPVGFLGIPEHLKARGEPGSYIIQARGKTSDEFRAVIKAAGAEIISYQPHNAYLVKADSSTIAELDSHFLVQATVPFEPYYKLDRELLPYAIDERELPVGKSIRIALFPGTRDEGLSKIRASGAQVISESEFPFGPLVTVYPNPGSLIDLAQMPEVQLLEVYNQRVPLNDRSRIRVGIAPAGNAANLHGLNGSDVVVGVNGSGVDASHPDFGVRVIDDTTNFLTANIDGTGHGTHVAGIIAGSGVSKPISFTNGSVLSNLFIGKAPGASIFPIAIFRATADPVIDGNGTITSINVIYESAGYTFVPNVYVLDTSRRTNDSMGNQLTPGTGALLEAVLTDGRLTSINVLSGGDKYTPTNTSIVIPAPLSEFQIITNQARHANIHIVNNSWGIGSFQYDITAAIYDAAVRDSMPDWSGEQGINYVFAAGNSGFANNQGNGGAQGLIESPSTAKNVISVGAIESLRNIRSTNSSTLAESDSTSQVAGFSSRGNVGIGLEGIYGRFKPDLVAPGTWILSLRSSDFAPANLTDVDLTLGLGSNGNLRYASGTSMAAPVVSGMLALMQQYFEDNFSQLNSPALNKALLINGARSSKSEYDYATRSALNLQGWGVPSLKNVLGTNSSASTELKVLTNAAGSETATIVMVEQSGLGTNRIQTGQTHNYRITVKGSASTNANSVRVTLLWTDPPGNPSVGIKLVNDLDLVVSNTANANIYLGNYFPSGSQFTEPARPGLTNLVIPDITRDFVNNVENVFIRSVSDDITGTPPDVVLDVRIIGRSVNVNATEIDTNAIAQDYVLVVSTGLGETIELEHIPSLDTIGTNVIGTLLNGIPLANQRVGANFPHAADALIGSTNQWRFYIFTNKIVGPITNITSTVTGSQTNTSTNVVTPLQEAGPNVAFATFLPPNLGRARLRDADIDVYVTRSTDPPVAGLNAIHTLDDPSVFLDPKTLKSTGRGGLELITYDDAVINEQFYIAVKSEDQQGGAFGFIALSTTDSFTQTNADGSFGIPMIPVPFPIPDGAPSSPGGVTMFGIGLISTGMYRAAFTNWIGHENPGDLTAILSHEYVDVFLMNHNSTVSPGDSTNFPNFTKIYDMPAANTNNRVDGPGSMNDYFEQNAAGLWMLTVIDDSPNHTGAVYTAGLRFGEPNRNQGNRTYPDEDVIEIEITLGGGDTYIDSIDVPSSVTELRVSVQGAPNTDPGVDLFVAFNAIPGAGFFTNSVLDDSDPPVYQDISTQNTNVASLIAPFTATDAITSNSDSIPPLLPGKCYVRVVNNTASQETLTLIFEMIHDFGATFLRFQSEEMDRDLADMAITTLVLEAPAGGFIADISVNVGIDHPRPSDLVLHLISPAGKKVLLFENRGGLTATNLYANFTDYTNDTTLTTSVITNPATGGMYHFTNLVPIKAITNQFTNVISPPLLLSSNRMDLGTSSAHNPEAIAVTETTLFYTGSRDDTISGTSATFGHPVSYALPLINGNGVWMKRWEGTWPGVGRVTAADITRFKDLVVLSEGVFMVASENEQYYRDFPDVSSAITNEWEINLDMGFTKGTFDFMLDRGGEADHYDVYYEGALVATDPFPGMSGVADVSAPFDGTESFIRLVINQGGNTGTTPLWDLTSIGATLDPMNPNINADVNRSVVIGYSTTGPTNPPTAGDQEIMISRGVTNNPYGVANGFDSLNAITSAAEDTTNMLYVVGLANFPGTTLYGSPAPTDGKFFISKLTTDGHVLWTATEQAQAVVTNVTEVAGVITGVDVHPDYRGTNYSVLNPTWQVVDLHDGGGGGATIIVSANSTGGGEVTGIGLDPTPGSGGANYAKPWVYIAKPELKGYPSAGKDVVVHENTTIFTLGYSNTTDNTMGMPLGTPVPTIRAYTTNGFLLWYNISAQNGIYNAAAVSGDYVYAVGAQDPNPLAGNETASMIEKWDLNGMLVASAVYTDLSEGGATPYDSFDDVIALTCPDRIYAIGTRTNIDNSTDAILVEIDPSDLSKISSRVIDVGGTDQRGVGLASDGRDLYALVQSVEGNSAHSRVLRYRIRNYYKPEEDLKNFEADSAWYVDTNRLDISSGTYVTNKNWTLRIADTRAGGTNSSPPQVRCWGIDFTYARSGANFLVFFGDEGFTGTLLGTAPQYFAFSVTPGVSSITVNMGVTAPISASISRNGLPSFSPGGSSTLLVQNGAGGSFTLSSTNGFSIVPGMYYLAIRNGRESPGTTLNLSIGLDGPGIGPQAPITPLLQNGVMTEGVVSAGAGFSLYRFTVPVSTTGVDFKLAGLSADLNLYLRKETPPLLGTYDYRSISGNNSDETIFLVTDTNTSTGLTPGEWYLGVENKSSSQQNFSIQATTKTGVPYTIVPVTDGQSVSGSTVVGNAPNNMYQLTVATTPRALLFEVSGLTGQGDLIIGRGQAPLASSYSLGSFNSGINNEIVVIRTNSTDTSLLDTWYFGILNRGETNINYSIVAKLPVGGLLFSETPMSLSPSASVQAVGDGRFGFGFNVVPGESYEVHYSTNAEPPWFPLTPIVAPTNGVIEFVHTNAHGINGHLFYRVRQVE